MWAMRDMTDQLGKKAHKKEGKTELNPFNCVNSIQNMYKIILRIPKYLPETDERFGSTCPYIPFARPLQIYTIQ